MALQEVTIDLPYLFTPRSYQDVVFTAFYAHGIRRFFSFWHRRSGKDKTYLNLMIDQMMTRVGNYCHVFPEKNQGRRIVWQGIDKTGARYLDHFPQELIYRKNEHEMTLSLVRPDDPSQEGSTYWVLGADHDVNVLVGANPIGVIWSEFALMNPLARQLVLPILRENGGWEAIATTVRGRNHAWTQYERVKTNPQWCTSFLTVRETRRDGPGEDGQPVVTEADIDQDRADGMEEATVQQEYYLRPDVPMPGAYYAEEFLRIDLDGRITQVPHDPTKRVYTGWDLGTSKAHDTNSIWFVQLVGGRVNVINYHQASNKGIPYFANYLDQQGYVYAKHFALHTDLDEADWGTGKTRAEQLTDFGYRFTPVPKLSLVEGINAVRTLLPRCYFDERACEFGYSGLRSFRREKDEKLNRYKDQPLHDWASHPSDSFRYLAIGLGDPFEEALQQRQTQRRRRQAAGVGFDPLAR